MTAEQDPLFEVQGRTHQPRYQQPKDVMSAETNRNKKFDGLSFTGDGLDGEWTYWSLAPEDADWRHEFHGDRYEHLWLTGPGRRTMVLALVDVKAKRILRWRAAS